VVADDLVPLPPGVQLRAAWAAARARNALRRQALILGVGLVTLLAALLTFVLVPREAMRAARQAAPRPGEKVDTVVLAASAATMRAVAARADSTIAAQRVAVTRALAAQAAARARAAAAAAGEATAARRGTLEAAVASLDRLLARAQTSPLPSSYRALAESPELRGDARVRVLADSLDEVEREREAFGVVGGVDPVYVSLTNTVTRLGRAIEAIAERRRSALQAELSESAGVGDVPGSGGGPAPEGGAAAAGGAGADAGRDVGGDARDGRGAGDARRCSRCGGWWCPVGERGAGAPPGTQDATTTSAPPNPTNASGVVSTPRSLPTVPAVLSIDSSAESATRASARQRLAAIETQLSAARARNLAVDRRVTAARTRAEIETPPLAMLGASAALALAAGFGVAFASEARRPRVADAREAERVTRTRVLAVVHPEAVNPERARRRADATFPARRRLARELPHALPEHGGHRRFPVGRHAHRSGAGDHGCGRRQPRRAVRRRRPQHARGRRRPGARRRVHRAGSRRPPRAHRRATGRAAARRGGRSGGRGPRAGDRRAHRGARRAGAGARRCPVGLPTRRVGRRISRSRVGGVRGVA
jgi:hypothetical protein